MAKKLSEQAPLAQLDQALAALRALGVDPFEVYVHREALLAKEASVDGEMGFNAHEYVDQMLDNGQIEETVDAVHRHLTLLGVKE